MVDGKEQPSWKGKKTGNDGSIIARFCFWEGSDAYSPFWAMTPSVFSPMTWEKPPST